MPIVNYFPVLLVRDVLRMKIKELKTSPQYSGPLVAVLFSEKYKKPTIKSCISAQSGYGRCTKD